MTKRLRSLASLLWDTDEDPYLQDEAGSGHEPSTGGRSCDEIGSDIRAAWPNEAWLEFLPKNVLQLPRLSSEVLPLLRTNSSCLRISFDLCKSPKATASTYLAHAETQIRKLFIKHPAVYKIGITFNPAQRWTHPKYGYSRDPFERWEGMKVIFASESSFAAALVESSMIRIFKGCPGCRNEKPGGETASQQEGPYFAYVVYRVLVPPKRPHAP